MSRRTKLSRRSLLIGGAGALIGLPALESLTPGVARRYAFAAPDDTPEGGAAHPKRNVFWFVPNGIHMPSWTPSAEGPDYALPLILEPLAGLRGELTVLTGLANLPGIPDGPGDHAAGTGSFLTARHVHKTEGDDIKNGISVDQAIANAVGGDTRFASVQLGIEGGSSVGGCDSGYSCAYIRNISWAGDKTPMPKMVNPQLVFDRFFAGFDPGATKAQIATRRKHQLSVLDYAFEQAKGLSTNLAQSDLHKLDEYMTSVRELELQIETLADAPTCEPIAYPAPNLELPEHSQVMSDLMVLALRCDLTRQISFMFGNGSTGRSYGFLGVQGGHHDISHHQNNPENFAKLEIINTFEIERFAYFLEKLRGVDTGDGRTLLDDTLVFFSSEISDGNSHGHTDLPVLLAGGRDWAVTPGRHVVYEQTPIANLFTSMLQMHGIEAETFGDDGTGPLDRLIV